jgi:hypothetical protein
MKLSYLPFIKSLTSAVVEFCALLTSMKPRSCRRIQIATLTRIDPKSARDTRHRPVMTTMMTTHQAAAPAAVAPAAPAAVAPAALHHRIASIARSEPRDIKSDEDGTKSERKRTRRKSRRRRRRTKRNRTGHHHDGFRRPLLLGCRRLKSMKTTLVPIT